MIWGTILGDLQVWSRRILRYRVLASNSTESPHELAFFSGNSHLSSVWFWNQRNAHRESGSYGVRCYQGCQDKVLDWCCIRANCTSHLLHVASGATVLQSFDRFWKKLAGSGSCMRAKFWHPCSCHAATVGFFGLLEACNGEKVISCEECLYCDVSNVGYKVGPLDS